MSNSAQSRRYRSIGLDLNSQISSPFKSLLQSIPTNTESNSEDVPNLDQVFTKIDSSQRVLWSKFEQLVNLNREIDDLINLNTNENLLPTPNDEFPEDSYQKQYEDQPDIPYEKKYEDLYPPRRDDYPPSSPESDISQLSQIEVELNEKLNRFAHYDHTNKDIIKLRNVVQNTLDLIHHPINDTIVKDINSESYKRSQELINRLIELVESYSQN